MRPLHLELEGFTAFRSRTELDFRGVDLFALTGPTGSGKSSIIDAIVFALYGSVPRHGRRDVAPIISTGRLEMKVSLEFEVAGRVHTVVRVVRRTSRGGANTDEARLECEGQVLAGTAAEVTETVGRLLGLSFDEFTKSVVLPQGEFARFLHDKPAARQDLLISLLGLKIYEEVAKAARARQAAAEGRADQLRSLLADAVEEETVDAAAARSSELAALLDEVEEATPVLEELEGQVRAATEEAAELRSRLEALEQLAPPPDLGRLGERLREAEAAVEEAEAAVAGAEARLAELPPRTRLEAWRRAGEEQRRGEARRRELETAAARATARVGEAAAFEEEAEQRLDTLRRSDLATHLRRGLQPGDDCPVCGQTVEDPPPVAEITGLEEATRTVEEARRARREAEQEQAALQATLEEVRARLSELDGVLAGAPPPDEVAARLAAVVEAEDELRTARERRDETRRAAAEARRALEALATERERLGVGLLAARDTVAALDPPLVDPADPTAGWRRLTAWRDEIRPRLVEELTEATRRVDELRRRHREVEGELRARCREAGIEPRGAIRDAVVSAASEAGLRHRQLEAELEKRRRLAADLEAVTEQAQVAKTLAQHLGARGFEKWLLGEALWALADGANRRLAELAEGRYSLAVTDNLDFEVVDHGAADERRSVRSLSGGETFLVSLSLALSLADHISAMAASETSRLESIFLDEGFGTLDAETLETVASVITDIGGGEKMVGLVTHVRDLADQLPVRFEVRSGPDTATVERVEA